MSEVGKKVAIAIGDISSINFDRFGLKVKTDSDGLEHVMTIDYEDFKNKDFDYLDTKKEQDMLCVLDELEEYLEEKKEEYGEKHLNAKGLPSEIDSYATRSDTYRDALCRLQVLRDKYEEE